MKPLTLQQLLNRAEVAATGAGHEALALVVDRDTVLSDEIFRFLVARGAAK